MKKNTKLDLILLNGNIVTVLVSGEEGPEVTMGFLELCYILPFLKPLMSRFYKIIKFSLKENTLNIYAHFLSYFERTAFFQDLNINDLKKYFSCQEPSILVFKYYF